VLTLRTRSPIAAKLAGTMCAVTAFGLTLQHLRTPAWSRVSFTPQPLNGAAFEACRGPAPRAK
jgi:hypothetical protein